MRTRWRPFFAVERMEDMAAAGKVCTGFSNLFVAKYSASGGTVAYSEGMKLARGVEVSIEPEVGDSNPFYAENVEAETVPGNFTGGTVTLTVDGLLEEAEQFVFGLPEPESVSYGESKTVDVYSYGDAAEPPYVGIGFLARYMSGGVVTWAPIVLTKARFQTPSTSAATQEEQIDWQTQELTADLMRDDSDDRVWKKVAADVTSEEDGIAVLKKILNITEE